LIWLRIRTNVNVVVNFITYGLMYFRIEQNAGNSLLAVDLLASQKRTLLHGVSHLVS
jgi:hypothetical protein